jgi:hypothetical protein
LRISGHVAEARPGPARGEGTKALLRELCGYDDEQIAAARGSGAFG